MILFTFICFSDFILSYSLSGEGSSNYRLIYLFDENLLLEEIDAGDLLSFGDDIVLKRSRADYRNENGRELLRSREEGRVNVSLKLNFFIYFVGQWQAST